MTHEPPKSTLKYPSAAQIRRTVVACERSGLKVGAVEISRDGDIKIINAGMPDPVASNDFDEWDRKGAL
jgi:hypothetical protein